MNKVVSAVIIAGATLLVAGCVVTEQRATYVDATTGEPIERGDTEFSQAYLDCHKASYVAFPDPEPDAEAVLALGSTEEAVASLAVTTLSVMKDRAEYTDAVKARSEFREECLLLKNINTVWVEV
jgi:hypothetical protein